MTPHRLAPDEPILPSHTRYPWYEWIFLILSALANVVGMLVTTIVDLFRGEGGGSD
jgi:hypothetical protein